MIAFLLFGGLCGLLIWISLWLHPARGTCVMVFAAGYEDNLAVSHNAHGQAGGMALAQLAASYPAATSIWSSGTLQAPGKQSILDKAEDWDEVDLKHFRERTLLLYFAMHGGADGKGAYLLPSKAFVPEAIGLGDPAANVLRLENVLDGISKRVKANRNVVLVLDCTGMKSNLPLGMLHNDFVHELVKLDSKIAEISNLVVLCASGVDQLSWPSDDVGTTIYSHFLIEGLQGAADGGLQDGSRSGRVNALELHHYVSGKVSDWVRRNRAAEQTPILLPTGNVGEQRARGFHLTVVPKDYVAPAPKLQGVFDPPEKLRQAWKRRDQLAAEAPPPAAYAPAQWRLYNDLLLRFEQLLQAGEATVSATFPTKLRDVEQSIVLARKLELRSLGGTLAMPAVVQPWGPADKKTHEALNVLWDAEPKDIAKQWATLQKQAQDKNSAELLRLKLIELALTRCAENPAMHLDKTNEVLHVLDNPLQVRSAEAHFLIMLHRDVARVERGNLLSVPLVPSKYLKPALEIGQRAERAALGLADEGTTLQGGPYAYAEQVMPWIRDKVTAADELRRRGHDLLFTSDAVNWDSGRDLLAQADSSYRKAQAAAGQVRSAIAVRDRVLSMLPYYSNWLSARSWSGDDSTLRQKVAELWPTVHALADQLEKNADDNPGRRALVLNSISETAERVKREFSAVQQAFASICKSLDGLESGNDWQKVDQALLVPVMDAALRDQLLKQRSALSRELFNATLLPGSTNTAASEHDSNRVVKAAAWQGKLALDLMGQRWVDEDKGQDKQRETFDQLQKRLDNLTAANWRQELITAGAAIGARWRDLPVEIAKRTLAARKADAAGNLRAADRLTRLLDGAGALQLSDNAARLYRQRQVQDVLLWQQQRTLLDHWANEDPTLEHHYKTAGQAFVKDAKKLEPVHEAVRSAEQQLNQEQKLVVALTGAPGLRAGGSAAGVLHWTSEDEFPLQFRIGTRGGTPGMSGHPVAWVETSDQVEVVGPLAGQRLVQPFDGQSDVSLSCALRTSLIRDGEAKAPALPTPAEAKVVVHGLFRGQHLRLETRLQIHPVAETVVTSHPLPAAAAVAVRAPANCTRSWAPAEALWRSFSIAPAAWAPARDRPRRPANTSRPSRR